MSTLSLVKKEFGSMIAAPQLIGADLGTRASEFWLFNQMPGGFDYKFSYTGHVSSLKAYQKCPPITSIINRKAQAYINGKTVVVNTQGKAKGKEATGDIATRLQKLMARPNPLQSWTQFEAQQYIYQQLFGYSVLLPIKPVGFDNIEATRLWNIPPFMLDIQETEKLFYLADNPNAIIKQIVLTYKNERVILQAKDVYIFKDFTPSFSSLVIPESRICSLEMPINNIIGAYESRNVLINYRGALGIISPDSKDVGGPVPLKEDDRADLQNDFMRYGLRNQQWKFIISSASVKWSQMGVPTKDLMLFEEIDDDIQRICDQYNYPYRLLSSEKSNSLGGTDLAEYKRLLYQDATLPEAASMYEQWNQFFGLDAYNLQLTKSYTHVAALQEDQVNRALSRLRRNEGALIEFQNNVITINQWRIINDEDPIGMDWANLYYYELVAKGFVFGQGKGAASVPDNSGGAGSNNQTATAA